MPLTQGDNPSAIHHNIDELVAAGHPVKQAVAAALHTAKDSAVPPLDPALRAPEIARSDANWNESDHPRDADGKFGSGGSSSKSSKLTPTEKSYVSSYSGDDFLRVNYELRAGKSDDPSVKHLDNAVAKSSIPAGKTLYRGMTREAAQKLFGEMINKGDVISDKAFASTSKSEGEARARGIGGCVLKIEVGSGAKGLDMAGHGRNENEDEVLLPRDAKMKVLGISPPKSVSAPYVVRVAYGEDETKADSDDSDSYSIADASALPADKLARRATGILFLTPSRDMLFMHRGDGGDFPRHWGFPGGHEEDIDGGDLEKTALREAEEETGLKYEGPLTKLYDDGHFVTYVARIDEPFQVTLCDESTGYSWANMPPEPAHPGIANTLRVLQADTELKVAELMRDGVLPSPQRYQNIYMLRLRISGTGMAYRSMVGEHVYRDASLYLNPEMIARCNGLPVILLHPEKPIMRPGDFENQVCGTIMLPFVDGEDLEGIARIYGMDAIEALEAARIHGTPISTSPAVYFATQHENAKVTLENGAKLLIEGKPALIDHLAICGLGVWDKGGPATGILLDNEDLNMATEAEEKAKADAEKEAKEKEEKEKADAAKADAAKKDGEKSFMDTIKGMCDSVMGRMDAWEKKAKADSDEKEKADKARADAESEEKAKADKAKKDEEETASTMADAAKFADAQAAADSVYGMLGESAPRPMAGEKLLAYRIRLTRGVQKHSAAFKDSDLTKVAYADSAAFGNIERLVFEDARKFARTPMAVADGQLREITKTTRNGHTISEFTGDPLAWMGQHMLTPKRVKVTPQHEFRKTH